MSSVANLAGYKLSDLPCGKDPKLWFSSAESDIRRAQESCGDCPARVGCLQNAVAIKAPFGVWGGERFNRGRPVKSRGIKTESFTLQERADALLTTMASVADPATGWLTGWRRIEIVRLFMQRTSRRMNDEQLARTVRQLEADGLIKIEPYGRQFNYLVTNLDLVQKTRPSVSSGQVEPPHRQASATQTTPATVTRLRSGAAGNCGHGDGSFRPWAPAQDITVRIRYRTA